MTDINDLIRDEARRIEEDCLYSSKGYYNASYCWGIFHFCIGIPATIFGVLAGTAIIKDYSVIAGSCSLLAAILTASLTFVKPSAKASAFKVAADQYLSLKNDLRIFYTIKTKTSKNIDELQTTLDSLSKRRNELCASSPVLPKWAFRMAKSGIEAGEAAHSIDREQ